MSISNYEGLDQLCLSSGIALDYYDILGHRHETSVEVKQAMLAAMQLTVNNDKDIDRNLELVESRQWQQVLPTVLVRRQNEQPIKIQINLAADQMVNKIAWVLREESAKMHRGDWTIESQDAIAESQVDAVAYRRFEVSLAANLDTGYHRLSINLEDDSELLSTIIVAPETCFQPAELERGEKHWGINLQLYSLRSRRNWGIGDFSDLLSVVEQLAPLGVDMLGLNPLHALFTHQPEKASPYSPSSRDFINPIYLDVEQIDDFRQGSAAQQRVAAKKFQTELQALRAPDLVDYNAVWALKADLLKLLFQDFQRAHLDTDSKRVASFRRYQQEGGEALFKFTLFEALQSFFYQQDKAVWSWQHWPEAYQDPDSKAVSEWAASNRDAIEFHQYLQWNADLQLSVIQDRCKALGMSIGIYRDLAVGNDRPGAFCWAEQAQYALDFGIGAPPDDFSLDGQNWNLPPPIPGNLEAQAYRHYIQTLRANMRHAGALRIDHIMGLMRVFWVPPNASPKQGSYLSYPFEDLLGILALESQRNACLIVGEDLGTVPDEVRHALYVNKILSYRILCFEKDWHQGSFKSPQEYPRYSLCTSGSHDLPTLSGFWRESDLALRERLKLFPSADYASHQRQLRRQDRDEIIAALSREDLMGSLDPEQASENEMNAELLLSIQRYLARSTAALLMVQMEDLLLQTEQLNLPGTVDEYPNWRRKLELDLEDWQEQLNLEAFALALNRERGQ